MNDAPKSPYKIIVDQINKISKENFNSKFTLIESENLHWNTQGFADISVEFDIINDNKKIYKLINSKMLSEYTCEEIIKKLNKMYDEINRNISNHVRDSDKVDPVTRIL